MIIKNAYVYTLEQGFVKKDTVIENGYFSDQECLPSDGETVINAEENYLIPGLVDVHFHGCGGYDFSDGTLEALTAIGDYELRNGITAICPDLRTAAGAYGDCVILSRTDLSVQKVIFGGELVN